MSSLENLFNLVLRPDGPAAMKEKKDNADRLPQRLIEYEGTVHQAIRNFHGVLLFHTESEGPQKALECFHRVLQDDKQNINALQNCRYVSNNLGKNSDVQKYEAKIQRLLEDTNPEKEILLARFQAELGFAMSHEFNYDRGSEICDFERFEKVTVYFERALKASFAELEESCQWHFFGARAYARLYDRFFKRQPRVEPKRRDSWIIRCVEWASYVIQNSESAQYKSKSWRLIGTVLFKLPRDHTGKYTYTSPVESLITKYKLQRELDNPGLCFEKARGLCPNDAKLVCRHARMFMSRYFHDDNRAIELLDQSIKMDGSKFNWLAFASRATVWRRLYQEGKQQMNKYAIPSQQVLVCNKALLQLAKKDFKRSLKLKPTVHERIDLAQVCHLLGMASETREMKTRHLDKALSHFCQAINDLEGRRYSVLHLKRGDCLRDCGEDRAAIESYKTALECEVISEKYPFKNSFDSLMTLMLLQCRENKMAKHFVSEAAFWFDYGFRKYDEQIEHYAKCYCKEFEKEMFHMCLELVEEQSFEVARFTLPYLCLALNDKLQHARRFCKAYVPDVKRDLGIALNENSKLQKLRQDQTMEISANELASDGTTRHHGLSSQEKLRQPVGKACNTKQKKYDFCALYTDENRKWVCHSLVHKLETLYKFKGFIPTRDIPPNKAVMDEFGDAVDDSVCTLAVVTPEFLKDDSLCHILSCARLTTDHDILLLRLEQCDIPSKITILSRFPVTDFADFPDWHTLTSKLKELTTN